jgi:hypothetical protein
LRELLQAGSSEASGSKGRGLPPRHQGTKKTLKQRLFTEGNKGNEVEASQLVSSFVTFVTFC